VVGIVSVPAPQVPFNIRLRRGADATPMAQS
jgi:hypothetical protein